MRDRKSLLEISVDRTVDYKLQVKQLKQQIENLKCCGNCTHTNIDSADLCEHTGAYKDKNKICKYWQSDNLTREDREK